MADITLDGTAYPWEHGSWQVKNQKLASSRPTATAGHSRTEKGAWKKEINIGLLCENNNVANGGKTKRDAFRTTYAKKSALTFIAPDGDVYVVYIDGDAVETPRQDMPQNQGYEYKIAVTLIEA